MNKTFVNVTDGYHVSPLAERNQAVVLTFCGEPFDGVCGHV